MKVNVEELNSEKKSKSLNEKIQELKYSLVYDFKSKQSRDNLLMYIMDV